MPSAVEQTEVRLLTPRRNGEMTNELADQREHARIFLRRRQTSHHVLMQSLRRVANALYRLRDRPSR